MGERTAWKAEGQKEPEGLRTEQRGMKPYRNSCQGKNDVFLVRYGEPPEVSQDSPEAIDAWRTLPVQDKMRIDSAADISRMGNAGLIRPEEMFPGASGPPCPCPPCLGGAWH